VRNYRNRLSKCEENKDGDEKVYANGKGRIKNDQNIVPQTPLFAMAY